MKTAIKYLWILAAFFSFSCSPQVKEDIISNEPDLIAPPNSAILNVSFTPCQQTKATQHELSGRVDVAFTNEGVQITHYNFGVACDFTTVNVTYTFVNGFLNITQQGFPSQANCVCYTDVSYTIDGISQNEVNVIFINGVQVYCHNENDNIDYSNIEDLYAQSLPVIQKCVEGKWEVKYQYGGVVGILPISDTYIEINGNKINDQEIQWERYNFKLINDGKSYQTYAPHFKGFEEAPLGYFISIKNDSLTVLLPLYVFSQLWVRSE